MFSFSDLLYCISVDINDSDDINDINFQGNDISIHYYSANNMLLKSLFIDKIVRVT